MEESVLSVEFAEHVPEDSKASMVSGLAAYGNVTQGSSARHFTVVIFRRSRLLKLREQLTSWERYGFLHWSEQT